jgi:transcriptional regulator with XRE-family HTH domain
MSTRDLERLAKAVKTARLALYPSRLAAAKAAGMSKDTWQRVEEGTEVRDGTYAKVEKVLDWPAGECLVIAEGAQPSTPEGEDAEVTVLEGKDYDDPEVREIVQLSAIATMPGLTGQEITALSERIADDLKRKGKLKRPDSP